MGGGASPGAVTSTSCPSISANQNGLCAAGTGNYINYYSTQMTQDADGRFRSFSFLTNHCSSNALTGLYNNTRVHSLGGSVQCNNVTLPVASYVSSNPVAAPLRGALGYSVTGVMVYGPFEAGFTNGQACTNGVGNCSAGLDVITCTGILERACGTKNIKWDMLPDDTGSHAMPVHYHYAMHGESGYDDKDNSKHSPLVAVLLDGRGLYGEWESAGVLPTLDACGGHVGPVPAKTLTTSSGQNVSFSGAASVYHYHLPPGGFKDRTTVGCFGPVPNATTAKSLYSTCGSGSLSVCTSSGSAAAYDTDCPIFTNDDGSYALSFTSTTACSTCAGNCACEACSAQKTPSHASSLVRSGAGAGVGGLVVMLAFAMALVH